jgi:hypothetical protein
MEVHHHGHHTGKKTLKNYIWEFLMLFFAVFCGFLAEWRLEVMIENHKEKEYMHSIIEDINADIKQTENLEVAIKNRLVLTDSLLTEIVTGSITQNSDNANKLWLATMGFPDFVQNDRTIQQLKNSGALRLINSKTVSDNIMEYDQVVRQINITQTNMNAVASDFSLYGKFFDIIKLNSTTNKNIPLPENGKKLLNEVYANRFF